MEQISEECRSKHEHACMLAILLFLNAGRKLVAGKFTEDRDVRVRRTSHGEDGSPHVSHHAHRSPPVCGDVYVHVFVFVPCICIRTYIYAYMHTCIHEYMHTCIHECMHACMLANPYSMG